MRRNREKGFTLILSLVLLMVMSLMGGSFIVITASDHSANNSSDQYQQAFYVAETALLEAEKDKTIIHLFNTKYLLDKKPIKNLPIGLHGDFYSHQLTFFMVKDNDLKNIKTLFNKCNLSINRIIFKSFT